MKITYTGKIETLAPPQQKKVEDRFAKLAKLLDMRQGEREAHVILTMERHLHNAEITVRFHDHRLVGLGSSPELFVAITDAQDKLEKQILKLRTKWRDTKRGPKEEEEEAAVKTVAQSGAAKRVFHVNHHERNKPMTLEEALLEMEKDLDYVVYRNAETDGVAVLVRRRDGHFDLIQA